MESKITLNNIEYKFIINNNSVFMYKASHDKSLVDVIIFHMLEDIRKQTDKKLKNNTFTIKQAKEYIDKSLSKINEEDIKMYAGIKNKKTQVNKDFSPLTAYLAIFAAIICGIMIISQNMV